MNFFKYKNLTAEQIQYRTSDILFDFCLKGKKYEGFDPDKLIEKNIHFIWVRKPIPEKYIDNIKTWLSICNDYKIYLWVDDFNKDLKIDNVIVKNIDELPLRNLEYYRFTENSMKYIGAWQSDILRLEVVYNYGGIYIDTDTICLKELDDNFKKSFVLYNTSYKNSTNAFYGAYMHSPILDFCLECLTPYYTKYPNKDPLSLTGPPFFTTCLFYLKFDELNVINEQFAWAYGKHTLDANWIIKK